MSPEPVPFVDLAREHEEVRGELEAALREVAASGRYVLGPAVERFEAAVAERLGVPHAVGVASGTDALALALEALGVGEGDEVITSPFTFVSTAAAILGTGARPAFADIDPGTFNLDPEAVEAAIGPRTAALVPVHLFGQMAELERLAAIADRHGLAVVEDAAQAFGAERRLPGGGVLRAGAVGHAGCFSFYPTKNLGGLGDGGLVATADPEVARRLRRLRNHGRDEGDGEGGRDGGRTDARPIGRRGAVGAREYVSRLGRNSRLDTIQAAALAVKLEKVEEWNERRRAHAAAYDEALDGLPGVRPPVVAPGNRHVYHQYTVRCEERGALRERLDAGSIGYAIYYEAPLHLRRALAFLGGREGDFPEAERAAAEALSLPVFPGLAEEERKRVVAALGEGRKTPGSPA